MSKHSKRACSVLLAFLLAASVLVSAFSADGYRGLTVSASGKVLDIELKEITFDSPEDGGHVNSSFNVPSVNTINSKYRPRFSSPPPASYDNRGNLTPVKDQGSYGCCWAFSTIAAAEADLIKDGKATKSTIDLSELHLAYFNYHRVTDPLGGTAGDSVVSAKTGLDFYNTGGNEYITNSALAMWLGLCNDSVAPYSNIATYAPADSKAYSDTKYVMKNSAAISLEDTTDVKQAIIDHGLVTFSYYAFTPGTPVEYAKCYNTTTYAYYNSDTDYLGKTNHQVAIVGWDDNYASSNFVTSPPGNGAWLVRNSWGTSFGDNGYFWLSYYDVSCLEDSVGDYGAVFAYDFIPKDSTAQNYQYDGGASLMYMGSTEISGAALYTATRDEFITGVNFWTMTPGVSYSIQLYADPTNAANPESGTALLTTPVKGTCKYAGCFTVDIPETPHIEKNSVFSVVISFKSNSTEDASVVIDAYSDYEWCELNTSQAKGQTFFTWGGNWYDCYNQITDTSATARIKAITSTNVNYPVESVTLDKSTETVSVGASIKLNATVSPSYATNKTVSWESSNTSVATVSNDGTVTGVTSGTATITASCGGKSATCTVTVTGGIGVSSVTLNKTSSVINKGATEQLTATVLPAEAPDKTVTWSTSNADVATVSSSGLVTGVKGGDAVITASCGGKSATCSYHVVSKATSIALDKSSVSMTVGDTLTLNKTVTPADANGTFTWTSSNEGVATVSNAGKVTAVGVGTATITCASDGQSATCSVTVTKTVTGISLNPTACTVICGQTATINATVTPSGSGQSVEWSSSNTSVATVSNGVVTGVAPGNATITAACGGKSATCSVRVWLKATSVDITKASTTINKGATEKLLYTITPAMSNDTCTWSSSNTAVATVDSTGTVTGVSGGTAVITLATESGMTDTCTVTVVVPVTGITLNKTTLALNEGATETLTATVTPVDATESVVWTTSNNTVATVSSTGKVSAVGIGTATITATCGTMSATCAVTVSENIIPVTSITLSETSAVINKGATKALTATVQPTNATVKTVVWTSADTSIATVSNTGVVVGVSAGSTVIKASCGGKEATCSVKVVVPAASISVTPASSTCFGAGSSVTLSATVTPADCTDTIIWTSSDTSEAIASISPSGKNCYVFAKNAGTIIVTATCGSKSSSAIVDVRIPVTAVTVTPTSKSLGLGESFELGAKVLPANAGNKNVTWTSSDEAVATVSASGVVTAVSEGSAVIKAESAENSTLYGTCNITVYESIVGAELTLTAKSTSYSSIQLDWTSVAGAAGYNVYRATAAAGPYTKITSVTGTSCKNTGLTFNKTYYYKVRAYATESSVKVYSKYSNVDSAVTTLGTPVLTVSPSSYSSVKLGWNKVSGANGYVIYRATSATGTYTKLTTISSGSTVSYKNTGLNPRTYYYKIRAYRTVSGTKKYSSYSSVVSGTPALSDIKDTAAVRTSATSAKVTWSAVSGATGYKVYRAKDSSSVAYYKTLSTSATSFSDSGLDPNSVYTYSVVAYRTVSGYTCYSSFSPLVYANVLPLTPVITAQRITNTSVKLSWTVDPIASGYAVYRATSKSGTYSRIATVSGDSYSDTDLVMNKTYYYKVRAFVTSGSANSYTPYSNIVSYKVSVPAPDIEALRYRYNAIRISWTPTEGASGYAVYRATSKTGTYSRIAYVTGGSSSTCLNTGVICGRTYYYKVRAYKLVGSTKNYGSYSNIASAKAIPSAPVNLAVKRVSSTKLKLTWNAVSGATGYKIYRSPNGVDSFIQIATIKKGSAKEWTNIGLSSNKRYYYKIRSYRTASGYTGTSPYSLSATY